MRNSKAHEVVSAVMVGKLPALELAQGARDDYERLQDSNAALLAALESIVRYNGSTAGPKALIAEFKHIAETAIALARSGSPVEVEQQPSPMAGIDVGEELARKVFAKKQRHTSGEVHFKFAELAAMIAYAVQRAQGLRESPRADSDEVRMLKATAEKLYSALYPQVRCEHGVEYPARCEACELGLRGNGGALPVDIRCMWPGCRRPFGHAGKCSASRSS